MNYIILRATGRLGRVPARTARLLAVAGAGSLYSLAMFVPGLGQLFSPPVKLLVSVLMVAGAFAPLPPRRMAACLGLFYLVSFALGGMVFGIIFFLRTGSGFGDAGTNMADTINRYFWPGLLLALLAGMCACRLVKHWLNRSSHGKAFQVPLTIELNGRRVTVNALVDTGNSLTDPLTGEPVIVVEYDLLKDAFPEAVREVWEKGGEGVALLAGLGATGWASRFRLIPFRSLGQDNGLLVGVRPEAVEICRDGRVFKAKRVVVGVYRQQLDQCSAYRALVPPVLMDAA
ncbi:hypothetical protein A6M21_10385 [Desulfotomaculum copahuensis]|uniref:Sporulation sigma-E factor-processing peptidase n=2 Tax=Desulfotomaculum copahuensis TaxID=1838280 RepID=A0A1B7LES4_9FIRM|nr:hypothetical protein A6M21_10385 [Desulfotomaculum copahuensis]